MINLDKYEVHLWITRPDEIRDPELLSQYRGLITKKEYRRVQRFVFEKDRHQALVTRALVRVILSHYADITPQDWCFSRGEKGKPEILNPPIPLSFNISHTENCVICAVTMEKNIGTDIEFLMRKNELIAIAERYFSNEEISDLRSLPEGHQESRFFEYWTLKESYIKATGLGLNIPLDQFTFHIKDKNNITISFTSEIVDNPHNWKFWLIEPVKNYQIAVALQCNANEKHVLKAFKTIPLVTYCNTGLN